jgi:phosphoglycerol transferase MdoB-like AlkP superfamily enzyme
MFQLKSLRGSAWHQFISQMLFWLIVFAIWRAFFLIYNHDYLTGTGGDNIFLSFFYALPLDISAACYILVVPVLIITISHFTPSKWLHRIMLWYNILILLLVSGISIPEAAVYGEWRTKLHYKALMYMAHPGEIAGTAPTWLFVLLWLLYFLISGALLFLLIRCFSLRMKTAPRKYIRALVFLIGASPLLLLGARGGLQQIPINQSRSYFSKHDILNLAAVNSAWNLAHSISHNYRLMGENPYLFYETDEAGKVITELYDEVRCDTTPDILNVPRPNIALIILEGWSADVIEELGGDADICPFFSELSRNGILFTSFYSSGTRSQQGMSALLSGFPALPLVTITQEASKYSKLPSLAMDLGTMNYQTSFYFGGELNYGNIKSYVLSSGFSQVVDADGLPSMPKGKLGVHDEYMLPYWLNEMAGMEQPFFSVLFTLSTHSPYDIKMDRKFRFPVESDYVNACHYADARLKEFFEMAKTQAWYSNTLFVLVSDHGHSSQKNRDFLDPLYHKIPLLFTGEVIHERFRGRRIETTASQNDFPATLLSALSMSYQHYPESRNLWCGGEGFGFFAFEEGFGWIRPSAWLIYDARLQKTIQYESDSLNNYSQTQLEKEGKAMLQSVFDTYMKY